MADGPTLVVDNTMGASLVGVICAAILYGVSCVQTWYYFDKYRGDVWYIKTLVCGIWIFDSIHQGLISHTVYTYLITNYNNPEVLGNMVWSILLEVLFNAFIGFFVQGFLTLRVWRLSGGNVPLIVLTVSLVVAEFGCSVAFTIHSMKLVTWEQLAELKGLSMAVNILAAVTDALIAGALCFFLHRSRTGFRKSDTMISKLIMFTVSTGVLTSICAIASLVSIIVWGKTLIYVAFYFSLGRLYSNSVLATLNARQAIRELGEDDSDDLSFSFKMQPTLSKSGAKHLTSTRGANISIKIDTSQQYDRDPRRLDDQLSPDSATTENFYQEQSVI
ncbi:hypothetical protein LshimejAT787_0103520 [Lyophyllum shimeji]|uniref:DUF6534 domain-containing protein n=1 Tax=Lyophyllum shimeji TaxID=47721 RepID=A0A9P3PDJ6_LYOSH|nr:hypothetical protein LshimejAT787_0103520 [Lyophyllum shimeji]